LAASASEEFVQKCTAAARTTADLARLRQARERLGFVPLPVLGYLERLTKKAGVTLAPILAWAGIDPAVPQELSFARGWARLASTIGVSLREALLRLRLSYTEAMAPETRPALVRQRATQRPHRTRLEQYGQLLDGMVSHLTDDTLAQLESAEAQVRKMYGED
jgi:hypothetical protein